MKITEFKTYQVEPRWLFLKLETDEGICGWGEPVIEGKASTVEACVREMMPYVIGRDPREIEDIFQVLYRGAFYRGGAIISSAISGIEQALWDIKGKFYGMPVYEFLGGKCRSDIDVYGWIGGDRPDDVGKTAKEQKDLGFKAIKMNATAEMHYIDSYEKVDGVLERVAAVRESCGEHFGIALDFHGRVHKSMAKILARELDRFRLLFIEEPVLSENYESFREIAKYTSAPIAAGERLFTRWDFKKIFEQGVLDIIQPDLSHAGGILEVRKIAAMAEAYDMAVAPHCPLGPVALAACLQLDACTPNAFIQEQSLGIHYNRGSDLLDYIKNPGVFEYKDGKVKIPSAPGLGIEVNEKLLIEKTREHGWKNPVWRNHDGTVAEW
ncbi:MAG: galactonate dehydratase [Clostridia bacterium]|jgi:galactonate dehydratase|nr:galactonate dehydratase [Clostridia bacterium]